MTAKATFAGVERMFSTFGFVPSKIWNQLGVEKAAKLAFLFNSLDKEEKNKYYYFLEKLIINFGDRQIETYFNTLI